MEAIIASLIGAAGAVIVCIINNNAQNKKWVAELQKRDALQAYRIEQLERKVDKHNNVIERTYKLEVTANVQAEKIKVANHRIDDLERKVEENA